MRARLRLGLALAALSSSACSPPSGESAPGAPAPVGPLSVYVVNEPLRYFGERIGGEQVDVVFPAPAGVDPATWSPDPETVAAYQQADLVLLNGAGYAAWVGRASLSSRKLVDTSASFADRWIAVEGSVTHRHGPAGEHSHEGAAFTTWLDPTLATLQARATAEAFARARPAHGAAFQAGLADLEADLRALDDRLEKIFAALGDAPMVFSHPVYQYLARRYGLNGRFLHWEPDEALDGEMWHELETLLQSHPARVMIWEGEPLAETAQRLVALGLQSVVYDPCADTPQGSDWLGVMRANARRLEAAFE